MRGVVICKKSVHLKFIPKLTTITLRELLTTQCFKDPQPLSCKDNGWGASGGGFEHWWLLGNVEVHSALKRKTAHSSGMTGSSAYGTTVSSASIDGKQSINSQESPEMYTQI